MASKLPQRGLQSEPCAIRESLAYCANTPILPSYGSVVADVSDDEAVPMAAGIYDLRRQGDGQKALFEPASRFFEEYTYLCGMQTDILLIGTMGNIADVVAENLASHSLTVESVPFPQNTFRDEFGYKRALIKAVAKFEPRCIFPVGHPLALAKMKNKLPAGTVAAVEDAAKIKMLDSKVESSRLAYELGILQPKMFDSPASIPPGTELIFKRENSFGGSGVYRPRNSQALKNLMEHEPGGRFLIEEYIEGCDYSVDVIRWNNSTEGLLRNDKSDSAETGNSSVFFRAACYRSLSNRGQGPATERESVIREDLVKYARTLLDAIDYNGICGMDFRVRDSDDKAFFLECNPRFTGGIGTQLAAGFEIPWLLYCCCMISGEGFENLANFAEK